MTELKPCPFCGGEAELVEGEYGMYLVGYAIYCKGTCGAKLGVTGRLCEAYEWTPYFDTEAEAIAAWNTRAERTCKNDDDDCDAWFKCSECGLHSKLEIMSGGYGIPNYCPNCGARVRSE